MPDQNQDPDRIPSSTPSKDAPPSPEGAVNDDLARKIEEGRKIMEKAREGKTQDLPEQDLPSPLERPAAVPPPETPSQIQKEATPPPPLLEPRVLEPKAAAPEREDPAVIQQREKTRGATVALAGKETALTETRERVETAAEKVDRAAEAEFQKADLAAERASMGRPLASEAARRADLAAQRGKRATDQLKRGVQQAETSKKAVTKARVLDIKEARKLDAFRQKDALRQGRQTEEEQKAA